MYNKKIKYIITPLLICAMVFLIAFSASAAVVTTEKNKGDSNSIFVAGNPDMYPLEYYNKETKKYEGVLPLLYEKIS